MRRMGCLLGLLAVALAGRAEIDPETILGVWLFDEGRGDVAADSGPNGFDGFLHGAQWVDAKYKKGLAFDGNDWVEVPNDPKLQVGPELTMMALFYAEDIGDWRQLIAKSDEYLLRIDPPQEGNRMSAFVKPGGNWEPRASASVPQLETWIHFAATYQADPPGGVDHLKVFVNGVRSGQSTRPGAIAPTNNPVEFGRWGGGSYFVGIIDEVALFSVALEEEDLRLIAENGLEAVLRGGLAVHPLGKLAVSWAALKASAR
ncbi:MAG: hypothetical protein KatS3mg115_0899 [Candidatus Poribacteria bacterium]|nr:MAG: hypothetical protein KatS3mg115_0899 [Candidatus Poribacteria bacterium]